MSHSATAFTEPAAAPHPDDLPLFPAAWYLFCAGGDLRRGPVAREMLGKKLVGFRAAPGAPPAIMDARCSHLGANLADGDVHDGCLRCPFHHWQYRADGRCTTIPAQQEIPAFARQRVYPCVEIGPYVFVYNGAAPAFPMPFFDGLHPAQCHAAKPFTFTIDAPWYLVMGNGFDGQHFAVAHDRQVAAPPVIESTAEWFQAAVALRVVGRTWRDRMTRFMGRSLTMTVRNYAGAMVLVRAQFRRTTSYGMACALPLARDRTRVTLIIWMPRSENPLRRALLDPLNLRAKTYFIRKFVEPDVRVSGGCSYHPRRLIEADSMFAAYLTWLARAPGTPGTARDP